MSKLSESAASMVMDLQTKIAQIVRSDAEREPKLTVEEQSEVIELTAIMDFMDERLPEVSKELEEVQIRLDELRRLGVDKVLAGEKSEVLAKELAILGIREGLLTKATGQAVFARNSSDGRIQKIKSDARAREVGR